MSVYEITLVGNNGKTTKTEFHAQSMREAFEMCWLSNNVEEATVLIKRTRAGSYFQHLEYASKEEKS